MNITIFSILMCPSVGCPPRPFSGVCVIVVFINYPRRFVLSILYESRCRNYALVASVGCPAGEKGEGSSEHDEHCKAFDAQMENHTESASKKEN